MNLPEGLETIGEQAFFLSRFTGTLTLPESLRQIGDWAFSAEGEGFSGPVRIPAALTAITGNPFADQKGITGITVDPDNPVYTAHNGMLLSKDGTLVLCLTGKTGGLIIPDHIKVIGASAFKSCSGLTGDLVIPEGVTEIGNDAFAGCGFEGTLSLPDSLRTIGDGAFWYCSGLTGTLTIPEGVTEIGGRAFADCSGFTGDLTITGTVRLGDQVFLYCSGFDGVLIIGEGIEIIPSETFWDCTGFKSVTLPGTLKETGPMWDYDGPGPNSGNLPPRS